MTQEEKQLLLKDLCARLPYNTKVFFSIIEEDEPVELSLTIIRCLESIPLGHIVIKPYLRSMSSMTEEEEEEYHSLCYSEWCSYKDGWDYHNTISSIDWLLEHHFDFRGLIERGLAIKITEENNPYKE